MSETLTTAEAAATLGLSAAGVRQMVHRGQLCPVFGGRPLRFRWLDVERARRDRLSPSELARLDALATRWEAGR